MCGTHARAPSAAPLPPRDRPADPGSEETGCLPAPCTQAEVSLEGSAGKTMTAKAKEMMSAVRTAAREMASRTRGNLGRRKALANQVSDKDIYISRNVKNNYNSLIKRQSNF